MLTETIRNLLKNCAVFLLFICPLAWSGVEIQKGQSLSAAVIYVDRELSLTGSSPDGSFIVNAMGENIMLIARDSNNQRLTCTLTPNDSQYQAAVKVANSIRIGSNIQYIVNGGVCSFLLHQLRYYSGK